MRWLEKIFLKTNKLTGPNWLVNPFTVLETRYN